MRPTTKKTKFGRKATEDEESSCGFDEEVDLKTIMIVTFLISLKCSTIYPTLPYFFKSKEKEESLVEVEKEHLSVEEMHNHKVITINVTPQNLGVPLTTVNVRKPMCLIS